MSPPEGVGAERIRRIIAEAKEVLPRLRPLSAAEFLKLELPVREMVLAPWLPQKGLALIHAFRGIGKTHLALSIAYAVACGGSLLGFRASAPRKVLYLDGEMPAKTMQTRLAATIAGFSPQPPDPSYFRILSSDITEAGLPDLGSKEGQAEIDNVIRDAEFITMDNISTLVRSGKENEAEGWLPVQGWALAHRRDGRSLLFVHHDGKTGLQRGTSRREDVLDTVIGLRRPADYSPDQGARFEVHYEKARGLYGEDAQPFEARYEERDGAALWTRTEITDVDLMRVIEALHSGMSIRDTATDLRISKGKVERLKKQAIERGMLK